MKRTAAILALAAGLAACGGKQGTITVTVLVPTGADPFDGAASVHMALGSPVVFEITVPVNQGHFDAQIQFKPPNGMVVDGPLIIEALDASGKIIARGQSPVLGFQPTDYQVSVWVGPVGRFGGSPAALTVGRARMAVAAIPRVGAFMAGGAVGGTPSTLVDIYDAYYHQVVSGTPLAAGRMGAVAIGFDRTDQSNGAALLVGGGDTKASEELTLFDPQPGSTGVWSALATDPSLARFDPTAAALSDGSVLVSGGRGNDGKPLASAVLLVLPPSVSVTPLTKTPMTTARAGHTATAITLPSSGGDGLFLFGGNSDGAAAEIFTAATNSFKVQDLGPALPTRIGHTATKLADGRVLIAGGSDQTARPLATGFILDTDLTVEKTPVILQTARSGHTATLSGGELLLCGGSDANGVALANCDVLDGKTLAPTRTIPLAAARTKGVAVILDTGNLLLAGGTGSDGTAVTTLELYTPMP